MLCAVVVRLLTEGTDSVVKAAADTITLVQALSL